MSIDSVEISQLAHVLYENGDKILNGSSKLSVNAALLQKISHELLNIATEGRVCEYAPFEVLSPRHGQSRTMEDLQFLHDFFQKTVGLKIENSANLLLTDKKIDLSKFKKLKYLELKRVPIKQLIGLKVVQHQVECIVCERGLTNLEHLLAECGGDNSTGFVWSELKEAVLSFNEIKILDSSVAFAPRLQVLDLSHNQIFDVNAIERLPNLKYVNLSYNSLSAIPLFNKSTKKRIEVLVLKNNFIEDLSPLSGLDALTELDLSHNLICCSQAFQNLLSMSTLHWLSIEGNPVCVLKNYRISVVKNLHISASFGNFVLDGVSLAKKEREQVGMELMPQIPLCSSTNTLLGSVLEPSTSDPPITSNLSDRRKRRSGKHRVAVIPNFDGTYEDVPIEIPNTSLSVPHSVHLETKALIERARGTYKDNWLRCGAAEVVNDILGLPQGSLSSLSYDDSCVADLLSTVELTIEKPATPKLENTITTTAVIEPVPPSLQAEMPVDEDSFLTCKDDQNSAYFSLDESREIPSEEKETSPDIETIEEPEEDPEDGQEHLYVAVRLTTEGSLIRREELFLSLSDSVLRERETTHGRTVGSWSLDSLESATRTRDREIHLVFDTIRRDRRERFYELEESEAATLHDACRAVLESRSISEMHQTPYRCIPCSNAFCIEKKHRGADPVCPVCGSKVVLQDDDSLCPTAGPKKYESTPKTKPVHNRSASVGVVSGHGSLALEIPKCSSHSSIGSAASLDEQHVPPMPVVLTAVEKRCDSDIEIISNPSQSSIEVIDAPSRLQSDIPSQEENSNDKLTVPNLAAVSAFTGLTESSSSGSVTDSICTAYENNSMVSSGVSKKSGLESSTLIEETSTEGYIKELLASDNFQNMKDKAPKPARKGVDKDIDVVEYSYTNFGELDHRIKLFVYAHLFEEIIEECLFLIRCQVISAGEENSYEGCVVCSNLKLYVLKVTGKEEGEEATKFLKKVNSLNFNLSSLKKWNTLAWNQGFRIVFRAGYDKDVEFAIFLKDPKITLNFLSFMGPLEGLFPKNCEWGPDSDPGSILLASQFLSSVADNSTLLTVVCFCGCQIGEKDTGQTLADGAILVTPSDIFILDSLKWMVNTKKQKFPTPVSTQKLCDLIQAGVRDNTLRLQFLRESEGRQELWSLTLASAFVVDSLLGALRTPWEELFSVPLQVTDDDSL